MCRSETEHKISENAHTSETTIFSHKYQMKVKFLHKWPYFHTLSIFYTQSFCYFPLWSRFFEILDFSWWSLRKYGASLANDILGLTIEVMKGEISSN
jgi:hypothetical protein